MKSPSNKHSASDDIVEITHNALSNSVDKLSDDKLADLAHVRQISLTKGRAHAGKNNKNRFLKSFSEYGWLNVTVPVAAVLVVAVMINVNMVTPVPEIPLAMLEGELPTEDLAMLEDLDFVIWLAKNEENMVL